MLDSDLHQTFAEVGVALTGFTGIVVVFGSRARGAWSELELARLHDLLWSSLNVVLFALLPLVLANAVSAGAALRVGAGFFALSTLAAGARYWRATRPYQPREGTRGGAAVISYALAPLGVAVIGALLALAFGAWTSAANFIYLGALLWSLAIGVLNFVLLLLTPRDGP